MAEALTLTGGAAQGDESVADGALFLRACRGERVERTPIWIMRQAGRFRPLVGRGCPERDAWRHGGA